MINLIFFKDLPQRHRDTEKKRVVCAMMKLKINYKVSIMDKT